MKVAIEARALKEKSGIDTYVRELLRHLPPLAPADTFEVLEPLVNKKLFYWWMNYTLPRQIQVLGADLVHFTKADVPLRKVLPTVVTIHDIIPLLLPETQSPLRRIYWPVALRRAVRMSDHIITISEASKRAIIEHLGADPDRITVTPLAVDSQHFKTAGLPAEALAKAGPAAKPYVLFVGRWDLRKNIQSLIRAFAQIAADVPHNLVIAGRPADKSINLLGLAASLGLQDRIIFKEAVPHEEMPALYAHADLFVYPTVIEGWGLPPLEAMAAGVPVITSDADPMREVVGDVGRIVPFSTADLRERLNDDGFTERLTQEMQLVLSSSEVRQSMISRGREHSKKFTWESVAAKTLAVYKQLV